MLSLDILDELDEGGSYLDLVGVPPDLRVHVSHRLLEDDDGPMLDVLKASMARRSTRRRGDTGGRIRNAWRPLRAVLRGLVALTRSGCGTIAAVDTSRIAALPIFADLPAAELDQLAAAVREVEVEAGVNVVTVDDYGTAIYFIEEGDADVVTDSGDAAEGLGPGDAFGEIALLLTGERSATVVARTPMRLLSLSGQDFERIRERVPAVERSLRRLGVERAGR